MIKLNNQKYITRHLRENIKKMIPLNLHRLKNLAFIVFRIIIG